MKMDEKLQWALTGVPARIGVGLSGGADSVAEQFDASLAPIVFRMLHME